ncbi:MAG: efflux RND transporter periplasmic adaptor subunit [Sedimentibacter sp.]
MITKKKTKRKTAIIFVTCAAVIAILLFVNKPKAEASSYEEETAKSGDIITYYSFSGNIEPDDEKNLVADKVLKIKEFRVKEGDIVNVGDVLYAVDQSDNDASLQQAAAGVEIAQINYDNAKNGQAQQQLIQLESAVSTAKLSYDDAVKNLGRVTALFNEGGISQQSLDQSQSQHDLAKKQYETALNNYNLTKDNQINVAIDSALAQLKQAQASYDAVANQMGKSEVKADISGEITEIYADENTTLMTGSPIMDIANYNILKAVVKVDEYDLSSVSEGKDVIVRVEAIDKEFKGQISKVAKNITNDSIGASSLNTISYYNVEADIEESPEMYAGMSVEVNVLNQSVTGAVTISMRALQFDDLNNPYVLYLNEQGVVTKKSVTVGVNDGSSVQITEGLNEGDVVQVPRQTMVDPFAMMTTGGE